MDYLYKFPSLKRIIVRRLSILLLTQQYVRHVDDFQTRSTGPSERDMIQEKVRKLNIPEALKKKLVKYIRLIDIEMVGWTLYHKRFLLSGGTFQMELLCSKLCWTLNGVIDKKKTAKVLMEDERLDVSSRYRLACVYCFENDILKLWNKLSMWDQKQFLEGNIRRYGQLDLVSVWTRHINGIELEVNNMIEDGQQLGFCHYALKSAACYGNEVAIEHFLQKLDPKERDECLLNCVRLLPNALSLSDSLIYWVPHKYYSRAMCYSFLQMSESQQIKALRVYSRDILDCLLRSPWLQIFIPTVKRMMDFLSEENYEILLTQIAWLSNEFGKVSKYQKLFKDFWLMTPAASKRYITHIVCTEGFLYSTLFFREDRENIALILNNSSPTEKNSAIFGSKGKLICENLIRERKWEMLRFFIEQCITSEDVMDQFKAELTDHLMNLPSDKISGNDYLKEFHELLDDIVEKMNENKSKEIFNKVAKRVKRCK